MCDAIGGAALLQLLLTYVSAMLFFDAGTGAGFFDPDSCTTDPLSGLRSCEAGDSTSTCDWQSGVMQGCDVIGGVLVAANSICFLMLASGAARSIYASRRTASTRRLRYADTDEPTLPQPLEKVEKFHLFLSHSWVSGQDIMRAVKQRLLEMMPTLSIFLDVDIADFDIGDLEGYVDASKAVLVFCSAGYFSSRNCLRELKRSVDGKKRLIAMLDPDAQKGGMTLEEVHVQAGEAHAAALLAEAPIGAPRLRTAPRDDPLDACA